MKNKRRITLSIFSLFMILMSSLIMTACKKAIKYDIQFMVDENTYHTINTSGNEVLEFPENPTKIGYEFDGWYSDKDVWNDVVTTTTYQSQSVTSNITIYAKFILDEYSITYLNLEGATNSNPNNYTVESDLITLTNLKRENYYFAGWYDSEEAGNKVETIAKGSTGDKTLYARWNDYALTLNYNTEKTSVREDDEITAALFGASCTDNSGESVEVNVSYTGVLEEGNTITVTLEAVSNGVRRIETLDSVTVYKTPIISSYTREYLYSDDNLNLLFTAKYKDNTSLTVEQEIINGEMVEGQTVVVRASVTDEGGKYSKDFTYKVLGSKADLFVYDTDSYDVMHINGFKETAGDNITNLIIPYEMEGKIVSNIATGAFENKTNLVSVYFPDSITYLAPYCFRGCTNLENIHFSSNTVMIRYEAFKGTNLKNIVLPSSLEEIGREGFANNANLETIVLPKSLVYIRNEGSFIGCDNLIFYCEAESKPEGVGCNWLDSWNYGRPVYWGITEENFTTIDGVDYVVVDGEAILTSVPQDATSVVIPETIQIKEQTYNVTGIGTIAFENCVNLTSIQIPATILTIGANAFNGCTSLVINCDVSTKPAGWDDSWNGDVLNINAKK